MLRSLIIYLSSAAWARQLVTRWSFAWRAASRFVAGDTLEDAIAAVRAMNQKGIFTTLDLLGESTTSAEEAVQAAQGIGAMIDGIAQSGVKS
ncbi:MAG TPA: hypothetical protein VF498_10160, partial [Anaerolineales bacterium]